MQIYVTKSNIGNDIVVSEARHSQLSSMMSLFGNIHNKMTFHLKMNSKLFSFAHDVHTIIHVADVRNLFYFNYPFSRTSSHQVVNRQKCLSE